MRAPQRLLLLTRNTAGPPTEAPSNLTLPVITGTALEGETLTATQGTYSNGPILSRAWQWYADDVAIDGETGLTFVQIGVNGAVITFGEVPTNAVGPGAEAVSEPVGPVAALTYLGELALDDTSWAIGVADSGAITGATAGSTITHGTLPAGLTIDGPNRTWAWDGTGTEADSSFTLDETLAGYANSPAQSIIAYTIVDPPDTVAPVLTSPSGEATGATTASLSVTTDEANGTLYWFVSASATPPSATDLKAGTGSVGFGSQAVTVTGAQGASATGLTAETTYYVHFLHRDAATNESTIATSAGFATEAAASGDITAPVIVLTVAGASPEVDVTYDDTVSLADDDALRVQADDDPAFGSPSVNTLTTITGTSPLNVGLSGASLGDWIRVRVERPSPAVNSDWSNVVENVSADVTAPVLSTPTATKTGETTADLGVTTDEANGTLYWVVTGSATAPSAAQVKAGQDHTGAAAAAADSQAVTATGVQSDSATGLSPDTTYYAHFMHEDAASNQSNVASSTSFTTDAAVVSLPTSGLILQLEADDISTLFQTVDGSTTAVSADNDPVGYWGDKSASAFHLSAAGNDTTRPTYKANGGLPYIEFDGSNDILRRLAALGMYSGGACTIAVALRTTNAPQSANNLAVVMEGSSSSNNPVYAPMVSVNGSNQTLPFFRNDANTAFNPIQFLTTALDGTDNSIIYTDNGSTIIGYDDGTAGTTRAYTRSGTLTLNRFALGGWLRGSPSSWLPMRVYAIAIWNRVLDSTERAEVNTYMAAKQGRSL